MQNVSTIHFKCTGQFLRNCTRINLWTCIRTCYNSFSGGSIHQLGDVTIQQRYVTEQVRRRLIRVECRVGELHRAGSGLRGSVRQNAPTSQIGRPLRVSLFSSVCHLIRSRVFAAVSLTDLQREAEISKLYAVSRVGISQNHTATKHAGQTRLARCKTDKTWRALIVILF